MQTIHPTRSHEIRFLIILILLIPHVKIILIIFLLLLLVFLGHGLHQNVLLQLGGLNELI